MVRILGCDPGDVGSIPTPPSNVTTACEGVESLARSEAIKKYRTTNLRKICQKMVYILVRLCYN